MSSARAIKRRLPRQCYNEASSDIWHHLPKPYIDRGIIGRCAFAPADRGNFWSGLHFGNDSLLGFPKCRACLERPALPARDRRNGRTERHRRRHTRLTAIPRQEYAQALQHRYRAAGYGACHRVGLMLGNRPAAFMHWFALNGPGASVVPLNADLRSAGDCRHLIEHSGICLAVTAPVHLDRAYARWAADAR